MVKDEASARRKEHYEITEFIMGMTSGARSNDSAMEQEALHRRKSLWRVRYRALDHNLAITGARVIKGHRLMGIALKISLGGIALSAMGHSLQVWYSAGLGWDSQSLRIPVLRPVKEATLGHYPAGALNI